MCVCVCVCLCFVLVLSHSVVTDSLQPHGLYSPPDSSVHGTSQARILGWVGCHLPSSGDLSDPGTEPMSPVSPALQEYIYIYIFAYTHT